MFISFISNLLDSLNGIQCLIYVSSLPKLRSIGETVGSQDQGCDTIKSSVSVGIFFYDLSKVWFRRYKLVPLLPRPPLRGNKVSYGTDVPLTRHPEGLSHPRSYWCVDELRLMRLIDMITTYQ